MRLIGLIFTVFLYTSATAQENSPYSRYGLGDLVPNHNILTRGMGGIAAGYSDVQSVNFINPASYGNLSYTTNPNFIRNTIFDVGAEIDTRTLKSINPAAKFTATNLIISYLQLGLPVRMKKANRKGIFLGVSFGLKPISKINYKIIKTERLAGIDSLNTLYEGSGGLNEANLGFGLRIKNFNIGFSGGYMFGSKDYSTRLSFINDTVPYYQSNAENKTTFGGLFINAGIQHELILKNKATLRLGAYGNLKQKLNATGNVIRETVQYDGSGTSFKIDSVYEKVTDGNVQYPASFGLGFTYQDSNYHWLVGVDFEKTFWSKYSFLSQKDQVKDNWKLRLGAEYFPAGLKSVGRKYFSYVRYRAGFYIGPDYISTASNTPEYGVSIGAGFPLKLKRNFYETQSSLLNVALEFGSRGNAVSNLKESIFRISFGLSLSDLWFNRSKYY
jgi:hypothetical protein